LHSISIGGAYQRLFPGNSYDRNRLRLQARGKVPGPTFCIRLGTAVERRQTTSRHM